MPHRLLALVMGWSFASMVWAFDSWPQWRGPNRDGVCTEKGLLDHWEKKPPLLWKAEGLGIGYAGVAVDRGIVCTMGDRNGAMAVVALRDKDGKEIWGTKIGDSYQGGYPGSRCTPTMDGDRIYALSPHGDLVCLETATGKRVWRKSYQDFKGRTMSNFGFSESPLVDGDKLICCPGGSEADIVALHKNTGVELWRCQLKPKSGPPGASYSSVVISHGAGIKQYVQAMGQGLVGIDAATGKQLWIYNKDFTVSSNMCTPIIRDDYVFLPFGWGAGSVLLKLERTNGGVKANEIYIIPGNKLRIWNGGAVLIGDHVYTSHQSNGSPRCVEFLTGKMTWKDRRGPGTGQAAVAYADGHLYYRYENGIMALIAANSGEFQLKGRFRIPGASRESWAHPTISNGRLYLREQNALYCYDLRKK